MSSTRNRSRTPLMVTICWLLMGDTSPARPEALSTMTRGLRASPARVTVWSWPTGTAYLTETGTPSRWMETSAVPAGRGGAEILDHVARA